MHRVLVLLSVITIVLLGGLMVGHSTASAAGPTIIDETLTPPVPVTFSLATCQDQGFDVLVTSLTINRRRIDFYDDAGVLVREIRHVAFTGSLANAVTGKTVPYDGHFTFDFDYVAQTVTNSGLYLRVHVPGEGVLALKSGHLINNGLIPGEDIVSDVGHTLEAFGSDLCATLA
jgi:hypothetical protein